MWCNPAGKGFASPSITAYGVPDATPLEWAFTGEQRDSNGFQYHRARYYARNPVMLTDASGRGWLMHTVKRITVIYSDEMQKCQLHSFLKEIFS